MEGIPQGDRGEKIGRRHCIRRTADLCNAEVNDPHFTPRPTRSGGVWGVKGERRNNNDCPQKQEFQWCNEVPLEFPVYKSSLLSFYGVLFFSHTGALKVVPKFIPCS